MHAIHKKYLFYGAAHKGQSDALLLTNVEAVNFFRSLELHASGLTPHGYRACYGNALIIPVPGLSSFK
jgi:hypothetical protein